MKLKWLFLCLALTACVSSQPVPDVSSESDVLEGYNRPVTTFNYKMNEYVLHPFTEYYNEYVPQKVRKSIGNFADNLSQPSTFVNAVLQGEPAVAAQTLGRFITNTTLGLGGLFDVATEGWGAYTSLVSDKVETKPFNMPHPRRDFGQTLYTWGVKHSGPYFVLPVLGPSTVRDAVGMGVDIALDPVNWLLIKGDNTLVAGRYVIRGISVATDGSKVLDMAESDSLADPYTKLKSWYVDNRKKQLGWVDPEPDMGDDEEEEDDE